MFRTFLAAGAVSLFGTGAFAGSIGFDITISNLLDGNGSLTNVPLMTLDNTSTSAMLTSFSFTIGDTSRNYDAIYFFSDDTKMTLIRGDMDSSNSGGNAERVDEGQIDFTDFDPGTSLNWRVDVDLDNTDNLEDYRRVLFNNGTAANAVFKATFSTGDMLSLTAPDGNASASSFTFSASQGMAAVPLPAGLPLMLAGLGTFAVVRRRKR